MSEIDNTYRTFDQCNDDTEGGKGKKRRRGKTDEMINWREE